MRWSLDCSHSRTYQVHWDSKSGMLFWNYKSPKTTLSIKFMLNYRQSTLQPRYLVSQRLSVKVKENTFLIASLAATRSILPLNTWEWNWIWWELSLAKCISKSMRPNLWKSIKDTYCKKEFRIFLGYCAWIPKPFPANSATWFAKWRPSTKNQTTISCFISSSLKKKHHPITSGILRPVDLCGQTISK